MSSIALHIDCLTGHQPLSSLPITEKWKPYFVIWPNLERRTPRGFRSSTILVIYIAQPDQHGCSTDTKAPDQNSYYSRRFFGGLPGWVWLSNHLRKHWRASCSPLFRLWNAIFGSVRRFSSGSARDSMAGERMEKETKYNIPLGQWRQRNKLFRIWERRAFSCLSAKEVPHILTVINPLYIGYRPESIGACVCKSRYTCLACTLDIFPRIIRLRIQALKGSQTEGLISIPTYWMWRKAWTGKEKSTECQLLWN